jgi:hypothetical protein
MFCFSLSQYEPPSLTGFERLFVKVLAHFGLNKKRRMHKRLFHEEPNTCDPPVTPGGQGIPLAGKRDGYALPSLL